MDIKWLGYIFQLERIEQNGSRPSALGPHPTSAPPSFRPAPEWILKFDFLNFDCITRIFFNRTHDIILKHTHIWCVWRNIKNHKTPRFWCYKICSLSWGWGPGSLLFNDWITSLSSRNTTQSFNIQDTVLNSLKPENKVFLFNITSKKSGLNFFYQFINYRAMPGFIFPNCLTGYEIYYTL